MFKAIQLNDRTLWIDWRPDVVGRYLDKHYFHIDDLADNDRCQLKQLSKELYLLAGRASVSRCANVRKYTAILRLNAHYLATTIMQHTRNRSSLMNNPEQTAPTSEPTSLDRLQATLFKLLTQYSLKPCADIAENIVSALTHLCQHPLIELVPEQRSIYCQSLNMWRSKLINSQISHRFH